MLNKLYKLTAASVCASLLLVTFVVAPVAAQMQPGGNTGTTPSTNLSAPQGAAVENMQNPCAGVLQGQSQSATQNLGATSTQRAGQKPQASASAEGQPGVDNASMGAAATTASVTQFPCPGTEPETAGPPFAQPVQSFPGLWHWYRFRYVANNDDDSDENPNVIVSLKMERPGCVTFDVTTTGRLRFPFDEEGDPIGPVGRGTPFSTGGDDDQTNPSNLVWVGSAAFSESYFVVVRNRTNSPCSYTLSITGAPVVY